MVKILFDRNGNPMSPESIRQSIINFGHSYNETVWEIIKNSHIELNRKIFFENVATLMPNFKMTRQGPFKGIDYSGGIVQDPNGQIAACWVRVGNKTIKLRNFLDQHKKTRARVLVEIPSSIQKEAASELWKIFKKLVSLCMGKNTFGLVAASKVLFAVLPEVALPIDNTQWRQVFKTIDYGDIIELMAAEITEWERKVEEQLDSCDPYHNFTLPSIYNVMAMKARP